MISKINKMMNRQEGVAAIEFALILPVLLLIIFGIMEFGLLLFNKQVITNASREGARAGIVMQVPRPTELQIQKIAGGYCEDYLISFGSNDPPITTVPSGICSNFQDDLIVNISYDYNFLLLPMDSVKLSAQTVMKCE